MMNGLYNLGPDMLTLVIFSHDENGACLNSGELKNIGVQDYQLLKIKKSTNFSTTYQSVLDKALFDKVIFISDHVSVTTKDWGLKLYQELEQSSYAGLGVIGSIKIDQEGEWFGQTESMLGRVHFLDGKTKHEVSYCESFEGEALESLVLDSSFFIIDKNRIKVGFDSNFSSRELFDTDFFLSNHKKGVRFGCTFLLKVVYTHLEPLDNAKSKEIDLFKNKHRNLPYTLTPSIILQKKDPILKSEPKLALLILVQNDSLETLNCLKSIKKHSNYQQMQIYLIDTGSSDEELDLLEMYVLEHEDVRLLRFNHSHKPSIYKQVVSEHLEDERLLLFLSPYTVLLNDAIGFAVDTFCRNKEVCGTVGVRLHQADNRIHQLGLDIFSHESHDGFDLNIGFNAKGSAYKYKNHLMENVLGSSTDFMLISRSLYDQIGGLNTHYLFSLSDFELNMHCILQGKRNFINAKGVSYFLNDEESQFLEEDYNRLLDFVNENIQTLTPYVKFYQNR